MSTHSSAHVPLPTDKELVLKVIPMPADCNANGDIFGGWVMAQGDHIVPIPGAKRIPHLEQNAAAVDLVLKAAELELLSRTFAAQAVSGSRYSPTFEAMTQK